MELEQKMISPKAKIGPQCMYDNYNALHVLQLGGIANAIC